jgi:hypothetical protein
MPERPVLRYDIEGQLVTCYQAGGDRLWHCECPYFKRTLAQYHEGFCPHVAEAIIRAAQSGAIDL